MSSSHKARLRFGIASLFALTTISALTIRSIHPRTNVRITFLDLELESKAGSNAAIPILPPNVTSLHQQKITIRGYIDPSSVFHSTGIRQFILARDVQEPEMDNDEFILVRMRMNSEVEFTTRPVTVSGIFSVLSPPVSHGSRRYFYEITSAKTEI